MQSNPTGAIGLGRGEYKLGLSRNSLRFALGDIDLKRRSWRANFSPTHMILQIAFVIYYWTREAGSGFLVPEHTEEVTKVSHAVLKAKVQKLAENLEACTRPMDEICKLLKNRKEFSLKRKTPVLWDVRGHHHL
ncbi:UNVERIFIED_CONTAM: hypothetical protein K2H54_074479 [Gekko kuhli]